jgi:hypothetical protein
MIEDGVYFVLKAPYQSGKTTLAKELIREINGCGRYYALYLNLSELKGITKRERASWIIFENISEALGSSREPVFRDIRLKGAQRLGIKAARCALTELCLSLDRPLVLIIDEIHALTRDIVNFLAEDFFAGFVVRERNNFPHSVLFLSVRDLFDLGEGGAEGEGRDQGFGERDDPGEDLGERDGDHKLGKRAGAGAEGDKAADNCAGWERDLSERPRLRGGAYNIYKTLKLPNFSFADIGRLCDAHNVATGQLIDDGAKLKIWDFSEGQPF